ncbi:MAG: porin family protein [Kofleriaceae bacterium]
MIPAATAIVLGLVATAHAQPARPIGDKLIYFGPRVGFDTAWLGGADIRKQQYEERIGAHVGGFVMFAFTPLLGAETGLFFAQKGNAFPNGAFKYDYLQLPLLGLVRATIGRNVRVRGVYGATLNLNVRSRLVAGEVDVKINDVTTPFDLGLVLGVGIESLTQYGVIIFDAHYEHGLRTIDDSMEHEDVKNRGITVSAGFGF